MTGNGLEDMVRHTAKTRVLAAAAVLALGAGLVACGNGEARARTFRNGGGGGDERREEAVPVEVAGLNTGRIEATLRFSATLEAERDVQVLAEATRRVVELLVEEGDTVSRGQLLVRLESDAQESALAKAESQLEQRRKEYERQRGLWDQNLVSEQVYIDSEYQVEQAQLAFDDARRELSYTEVRAPIAGTISERMVNLGDFVAVNQPLFRLVDFDSIVARIYVPESDLQAIAVGQPARLSADAAGGQPFAGDIERIAPIVDPGTGTVKVTVATPRQKGLRPGMYVQVELVTAVHDDAILLPKKALVYDNDQIFAFRLGDERRVERVVVDPALEDADWMEPVDGFSLDDQIVVAGQSGLKDGALVRLPGDPDPDASSDDDTIEEDGEDEPSSDDEAA
jgi:membrane fusion protein (multidrug efflux system)